jgi:tetratricopeptide (TPR) repeat protein
MPYVQAASLGSDAIIAFQKGGPIAGLDLMEEAISTAPDVEAYYSIQAEMLNAFAADPSAEAEIAQKQYALNSAALEANPLSHSARASLAASALKLAQMGNSEKGAEAVRLYTELIRMLPGYEPIYNDLATAQLILGQPAQALATLDEYAKFTSGRKTPSAVSHYLQSVAYQDLGRPEEAITSLERFVDASPETEPGASYIAPAHRRLADLYKVLGTGG